MRSAAFTSVLATLTLAGACAQRETTDPSSLAGCTAYQATGLSTGACRLEANSETLRVEFAAPGDVGVVAVNVLDEQGDVRQLLMEEKVEQHIAPYAQDVDGDGRADIIIPRARHEANTVSALWLFSDEGYYRRLGEVSGYDFARTEDGLLTVWARNSPTQDNSAYYAMIEGALHLIASVNVELGDDGERRTCALADAPGIDTLSLTADQAETRFCGGVTGAANE
ncbi:MAG: hypothetical protein K2P58_09900 [Hyphomonadaceae bacterium]|nr:hypothetical protein [Hyphomonadaceae bacterium]